MLLQELLDPTALLLEEDMSYYLEEGCGVFALALALNFPGGDLWIISNRHGEPWDDDIPYEVTHVFYKINDTTIDVKGVRPIADMVADFGLSGSDITLKGPFTSGEFQNRFVGDDDDFPLFGSNAEIRQAAQLIRDDFSRYDPRDGIAVDRLVEKTGDRETVWFNARTGEWIDIDEYGSIHHNEFLVDNADRFGLEASSIVSKMQDAEWDDMIASRALQLAALKKGWVRINCAENGWHSLDGGNIRDVHTAALEVADRYEVEQLYIDLPNGRGIKLVGKDAEEFLHTGRYR